MLPKRRTLLLAAGTLCVMVLLAPAAQAITIRLAEVQNDVAVVKGRKAAAYQTISWQGVPVTTATKNGSFSFEGEVPSDCVGILSDGVNTIDVELDNCPSDPGSGGGGPEIECEAPIHPFQPELLLQRHALGGVVAPLQTTERDRPVRARIGSELQQQVRNRIPVLVHGQAGQFHPGGAGQSQPFPGLQRVEGLVHPGRDPLRVLPGAGIGIVVRHGPGNVTGKGFHGAGAVQRLFILEPHALAHRSVAVRTQILVHDLAGMLRHVRSPGRDRQHDRQPPHQHPCPYRRTPLHHSVVAAIAIRRVHAGSMTNCTRRRKIKPWPAVVAGDGGDRGGHLSTTWALRRAVRQWVRPAAESNRIPSGRMIRCDDSNTWTPDIGLLP